MNKRKINNDVTGILLAIGFMITIAACLTYVAFATISNFHMIDSMIK